MIVSKRTIFLELHLFRNMDEGLTVIQSHIAYENNVLKSDYFKQGPPFKQSHSRPKRTSMLKRKKMRTNTARKREMAANFKQQKLSTVFLQALAFMIDDQS